MGGVVVITPARDEAENLPRLADSLIGQSRPFDRWVVVDNGSADGTQELVRGLAARDRRIELLIVPSAPLLVRGAPSARALNAGVATIPSVAPPDLVLNVDADVSLPSDYIARLARAFAGDPALGIAGGS